jgi:hypothetical protein
LALNCDHFYTLVGKFEADSMSYPFDAQCDFGYVHETKTCRDHAYWNERANQICRGKAKRLENYGILLPCGTDVFTGVEYVCCKVVCQHMIDCCCPGAEHCGIGSIFCNEP